MRDSLTKTRHAVSREQSGPDSEKPYLSTPVGSKASKRPLAQELPSLGDWAWQGNGQAKERGWLKSEQTAHSGGKQFYACFMVPGTRRETLSSITDLLGLQGNLRITQVLDLRAVWRLDRALAPCPGGEKALSGIQSYHPTGSRS